MANRHRGEVSATLNGQRYTLCLTLGALAELEDVFGVEDLTALAERFASGRLSSRDIVRLLGVAIRGGGGSISDEEVARFPVDAGLETYVRPLVALLGATFGGEGAPENP